MDTTIFLVVTAAGLFAASYLMNRRFGLLGLALAAGALIARFGAPLLTPLVQNQGVELSQAQIEVVVTLLPALLLLFIGPTYGKMHMRIIGSALFALLALVLVIEPLSVSMAFDVLEIPVIAMLQDYQGLIIVIGLLIALGDVFIGRSGGSHKVKKSPH
jgi:hypothetical protein